MEIMETVVSMENEKKLNNFNSKNYDSFSENFFHSF